MRYQVKTGSIEVSDLLQHIARRRNWNISSGMKQGGVYPYIVIYPHEGRIDWNRASSNQYHTIDVIQAVKLLKNGPTSQIKVGDYPVSFHDDGSITVGCVTIPLRTVNAIQTRAFDMSQASQ